jgi:hypothetical protein
MDYGNGARNVSNERVGKAKLRACRLRSIRPVYRKAAWQVAKCGIVPSVTFGAASVCLPRATLRVVRGILGEMLPGKAKGRSLTCMFGLEGLRADPLVFVDPMLVFEVATAWWARDSTLTSQLEVATRRALELGDWALNQARGPLASCVRLLKGYGWFPHTVDPAVWITDGGVRIDFRDDAPLAIRAYAEQGARRLSWKVWKGNDARKPLVPFFEPLRRLNNKRLAISGLFKIKGCSGPWWTTASGTATVCSKRVWWNRRFAFAARCKLMRTFCGSVRCPSRSVTSTGPTGCSRLRRGLSS